jgi:putative Holliday junction resolvase
MPVIVLTDTITALPRRGALIGLDLGTKTIGVAVSDPDRRLAAGVTTIARRTFSADAERVLTLAAERQAVGFILGDQHAAAFILQGALDRLARLSPLQ